MKGWSKTTRIGVMMALDAVFLAVELGVGYYVSSLALIADAFHMLNDIISLAVGLWAVNLARKESNDRYSYGWLRAEILGAFFNATFLIGLCVTIVLEAIQRFFDPPNIRNPEVVLVVGFFGLLSNLVGFWVLGGHGHSHGPGDVEEGGQHAHGSGHEHAHDHAHSHDGHVHDHEHSHAPTTVDDETIPAVDDGDDDDDSCPDEHAEAADAAAAVPPADAPAAAAASRSDATRPLSAETGRYVTFSNLDDHPRSHERSASRGSARSRGTGGVAGAARSRANSVRRMPATINDISIHPASFRNDIREIIAASQARSSEQQDEEDAASDSDDSATVGGSTALLGSGGSGGSGDSGDNGDSGDSGATGTHAAAAASERTPLLGRTGSADKKAASKYGSNNSDVPPRQPDTHAHAHSHDHPHHAPRSRSRRDSHGGHHHNAPREAVGGGHGHGHSHGDMGMNAMVLHVIGDALGNIGVIVTALIIWKTEWTYRMYADPLVSLFITLIILKSAIPLTKATSKILLQATPDHININDIREDIQDLDGVRSCHHVHVWQLSDTQIVASLHIEVSFPISEYGGERYMTLARRVRKCLHGYGIHSATIQPEFRLGAAASAAAAAAAAPPSSGHDHGHDHSDSYSTHAGHGSSGADDWSNRRGRLAAAAASAAAAEAASAPAPAAPAATTRPATATAKSATSTLPPSSSSASLPPPPPPPLPPYSAGAAGSATMGSAAAATTTTAAAAALDGRGMGPSCLLDCVDDCVGQGCCSQGSPRTGSRTASPPGSSAASDHGHHH